MYVYIYICINIFIFFSLSLSRLPARVWTHQYRQANMFLTPRRSKRICGSVSEALSWMLRFAVRPRGKYLSEAVGKGSDAISSSNTPLSYPFLSTLFMVFSRLVPCGLEWCDNLSLPLLTISWLLDHIHTTNNWFAHAYISNDCYSISQPSCAIFIQCNAMQHQPFCLFIDWSINPWIHRYRSIRPSVRPSIRPSVRPSIHPSMKRTKTSADWRCSTTASPSSHGLTWNSSEEQSSSKSLRKASAVLVMLLAGACGMPPDHAFGWLRSWVVGSLSGWRPGCVEAILVCSAHYIYTYNVIYYITLYYIILHYIMLYYIILYSIMLRDLMGRRWRRGGTLTDGRLRPAG